MIPAWLRQQERSNLFALRTIIWITLAIGRRAARALLYPISVYFVCFSSASRRGSRTYLRRLLGREVKLNEIFKHYHTFAAVILDRVFFLCGRLEEFDLTIQGEEIVQGFCARREGCFLIGAHFGSFEILRATGTKRANVETRFAMFDANAQKIATVFRELNPRLAEAVIPLGTPDAMLKINEELARGAFVGMLGDRSLGEGKTASCDFLGAPASFPTGPWKLACALDRPVILGLGIYQGDRRYAVHFECIVENWPADRRARNAAVEEAMRRYVRRLEEYCRAAPYNWFNFYDFWSESDEELAVA